MAPSPLSNVAQVSSPVSPQADMKTALTIGNFDGVHLGHRRLIQRVLHLAREHDLMPALLTFDPHPARVLAPERAPRLLTTLEQRTKLIQAEGIAHIEVLPFTAATARLTAEEFVKEIVVGKLSARAIVVGHNFRFGNKAAGNVAVLHDLGHTYGFETDELDAVTWRGTTISSSVIRACVQAGEVSRACRMLGRAYTLEGEVVHGHGVGSKKTVPTLNLNTAAEVLPAVGVYITRTSDLTEASRWNSVTNVGYRPTFGSEDRLSIETFLLEPLVGATPRGIKVEFLKRLREERKFDSAESLKKQILHDVGRAQTYFRRCPQNRER
jgi:riboflavin kinase/FMN adenylyltransferase